MSNPLTITNISSNDIAIGLTQTGGVTDEYEYCFVGSSDWHTLEYNNPFALDVGDAIRVRAKSPITGRGESKYISFIIAGGNVSLSGNINSMITPSFDGLTNISAYPYAFARMFWDNPLIVDSSLLELPATTLANGCYNRMFEDCYELTKAPNLPATILADGCYAFMFAGCHQLTKAPNLPATSLTYGCYAFMFEDCWQLTKAPNLPATSLAERCYYAMFSGCEALTKAPKLIASTLESYCYCAMFFDCISLEEPPVLPARWLQPYCYHQMFQGCTSIKLSETQSVKYPKPYRIPTDGPGLDAIQAVSSMFSYTGGPFHDTPELNTTYYLYEKPREGVYHWNGADWKLDGDVSGENFKVYYQEDEPVEGDECDLWVYRR